eukprot:scaffold19770_cov44-Cyclotella_meneghiniana.AAC.3
MLKEKQMREEAKVTRLQGEVSALKKSAGKAERKAKYLEVVKKNENWEYPGSSGCLEGSHHKNETR